MIFALKFRPFDEVEGCFDIVASVDRALLTPLRLRYECNSSYVVGSYHDTFDGEMRCRGVTVHIGIHVG